VNLGGATNPTGIVTFRLFGVNNPDCSASAVFTSNVRATGTSVNSASFFPRHAGTFHWEVSYAGDATNGAAGPTSCSDPAAAVVVTRFYTNLAVSAGKPSGPTISASAALFGYNPKGTVTFLLTPPGDAFCSGTPVFTSTIAVNGNASYSSAPYTYPVGGDYKWRAVYSGDPNNSPAGVTSCLDANASVTVPPPVVKSVI
jgi:hypothetical protein